MAEIDNRLVIDSEWSAMEKQDIPKGQFDRWGGFVHQDYLWEVAAEQVVNEPMSRDSFLENVLDFIESDKEATEKFLKWFYPDYKEE